MTRKMMYAVLQFLTYGMLIGFSFEEPIIGKNVRDARADEFPFVVSIARRPSRGSSFRNRHFCTGTLISSKNVLTASHCLVRKKKRIVVRDVEIIAGHADVRLGEKYYPKSWITFDKWMNRVEHPDSFDDIAIIRLKGSGIRRSKIKPAFLRLDPIDLYKSNVRIAGWGKTEDDHKPLILKTAELKVISQEECNSNATQLIDEPFILYENYLCSFADPWVVATGGDSGTPILNERNQVVGVHLGVCPSLEEDAPKFHCQKQMNTHLYLYPYEEFIRNMTRSLC